MHLSCPARAMCKHSCCSLSDKPCRILMLIRMLIPSWKVCFDWRLTIVQDRPGIACLIIDKHTVLLHLDRERASKRLTDSNQSIHKSTPRRQKDAKRPQGYPEIPFRLKLNKTHPQNAVCNLIFLIFRQLRIPECVGFPPSSLYRSTPVSLPPFRP